jgi:hypothetical protein
MQVLDTTLPMRFSGGGGSNAGILSYPDIENIIFVDQGPATGTEDGTQQDPFHTLADALTAAAALTPAIDNQVVIFMYPGLYVEQSLQGLSYVDIVGADRDSVIIEATDEILLTIDTKEWASLYNLSFHCANVTNRDAVYSKDSTDIRIVNCRFYGAMDYVTSYCLNYDDVTGEVINCDFERPTETTKAAQFFASSGHVIVQGCRFIGDVRLRTYDGLFQGNTVYGLTWIDSPTLVVNDNYFSYSRTTMGLNEGDVIITNNTFDTPGQWSIQAGGVTTPVSASIKNNVMFGLGMYPDVFPVDSVRYVGTSGDKDFFDTFNGACATVNQHDTTIKLLTSKTAVAATAPPSYRIHVDGQRFSLGNAAATWLTLSDSDSMDFRNVTLLGGLQLGGDGSYLGLLIGTTLNGGVILVAGASAATQLVVSGASILGTATYPKAIDINDADPSIVVRRGARVKGSADYALYWNSGVTNNNVELKHSVIWHGSGGANNPFGRDAAQTPAYSSYQCAFNSDPEAGAVWTNNIVGAGLNRDSIDVNTDY